MKMYTTFVFLLFITFFGQNWGEQVRYDGFKVYRLTPKSQEAVENLRTLESTNSGYDFWTDVRGVGHPVDIMVPPHYKYRFNDVISSGGFDARVYVPDVQKLIDNETPRKSTRQLEWTEYHDLEEIYQFLRDLVKQYPDIVTLISAGRTYEGRDILGVKVSYSPANENRTAFIESNIHAREWITSAVATWTLNELLTSNEPNVRQVAESHDWYFVPVFNPDGFVYTKTTNRMWRKTRTPYFLCNGVDPNRNWGYHFNDGGSSGDPCSDTYRGPSAFSETSTRTISEFITTIAPKLQAYISLHSYSQMFLLPYGFSSAHLDNYDQLYEVGIKAAASLAQRNGTEYTVGNIVEIMYVASGGSMDWVKGTFGTPITYTYELRDKGTYGFILPPDQILPCAEETFDSLITIFEEFDKLLP
ncbi:hypothetical protein Zmor_007069 [Zophobas morio]|uniref:Zinc carboxypeptidase A 1 n=1 Tax=Zophobas morio TaxID=2755281 RepID=A0AA38MPB1_9CUCU|nr:hypothetical protein Zmor_007069 [Zophobas morio]